MEHKIKLTFGHTDKKGEVHRDVTFGKRLTAGDMMLLDNDPQSQNSTQYVDLIRRMAITAFGGLKMPPAMDVLLGLNSIDRADLAAGFDKFLVDSREGRTYDYRDSKVLRLYFGFQIEGTEYSVVEFGRLNTGRDEVEADALATQGVIRECFLLGRRITQIRTEDGSVSIDGPVDLDKFRTLDAEDLTLLRTGARIAEAFFRLSGKESQTERNAESSTDPRKADGNDGSGHSGPADGEDSELPDGTKGAL